MICLVVSVQRPNLDSYWMVLSRYVCLVASGIKMSSYSAVIIARNEEKHIQQTAESILNQSIKPHRIIVVDDGSTDATLDILNNMPVVVKRMPNPDSYADRYHGTMTDVYNAGLSCIRNDPVDWAYSGDADIILPSKYCETMMKHATMNDACVASGIINARITLPMEGCKMLRHDWFNSVGMELKWESIYICVMALLTGKNTLVRYNVDCTVTSQRPMGGTTPHRQYNKGKLTRRMGESWPYMLYSCLYRTRLYGFTTGLKFLRGVLDDKCQVSSDMKLMYRRLRREERRWAKSSRSAMICERDGNIICHPPSDWRR